MDACSLFSQYYNIHLPKWLSTDQHEHRHPADPGEWEADQTLSADRGGRLGTAVYRNTAGMLFTSTLCMSLTALQETIGNIGFMCEGENPLCCISITYCIVLETLWKLWCNSIWMHHLTQMFSIPYYVVYDECTQLMFAYTPQYWVRHDLWHFLNFKALLRN